MTEPFTEVPVIDVAPFLAGDPDERTEVASAVARACEQVGFLYITGHGVPQATIEAATDVARRFYALPNDEKQRVHMDRFPNHRGYVGTRPGARDDGTDYDRFETFKVGFETPDDDPEFLAGVRFYGPNAWPERPCDFRDAMEAYYAAMLGVSDTLFRLFAVALDLDEEHFLPWAQKPASIMNVNHYRGGAPAGAPSGIREHSDYECFAVLWQDANGGLELKNQAGEWIAAPPIPGTFVINIGDIMARWTNDRFACTPHRVIYRGDRDRLSIAFFGNCDYSTPVECLPSCTGPGNPPKYEPTTVGEHLIEQVRRAYKQVAAYAD